MKPVRTATFNGVKYDIHFCGHIDGMCSSPRGETPSIHVCTPSHTRREFETLIHEMLHAEGWAKSEDVVHRTAHEIARVLWRLHFRRP